MAEQIKNFHSTKVSKKFCRKNNFDFKSVEKKWMNFWEKEKLYQFDVKSKAKVFSVDTPPPTVSGEMHIGHACSYSQQDFLVRYKRMRGFNVFYPFGTDDNGLPTERLVEKKKSVKSKEISREKFIRLCMDFLKDELPRFIQDWKNIGISCDWDAYYSTIDERSRRLAQWSFLDLYKKGRMERRDAPAMYCPECQTGIAQVEVEDKDFPSTFVDVNLKVDGNDLIISTTRPELFPASVAVFYHPDDERYKSLKGKKAKIPLFDIEVPIMEDERVDMDKGTGIAYSATFGDQKDMEWQKAYNLPIKEAIGSDGKMTSIAGKYEGMKVKDARKEIIKDLKKGGFLIGEKEIVHPVNVHERCGTEIEFVKSKQWFLRYLDLRKDMLKWGVELNWYPKFMKVRYDNWVKGLQWDWLVSNQRHFGVSFPVWYCENCEEVIIADEKDLPVDPLSDKPPVKKCPKCKSEKFVPETDVLNTWFTSSMTPRIVNELVGKKMQNKIFPMSLRPQAHEIISFWLFNTLVKSRLHFGKNPWKDVAISGFVTLKGEKMSKSKGNVIRPQEVMEKYGADAVRFWAASSKLGKDFDYQEQDVVAGKRLVTKLLNASKFVFMNLEDWDFKKPKKLEPLDELFLGELNSVIKSATENFERYNYSMAKSQVENFFWSDFADYYFEFVKPIIYNEKGEIKKSAQYVLYRSLFDVLKMMAPIMPFITEEIYQKYFKINEKIKSIHIFEWPKIGKERSKKDWRIMKDNLSKVRKAKTENRVSLNLASGVATIPVEEYSIIQNYKKSFLVASGATCIKKGEEFNIEIPKAGTEHKL